MSTRTGQATASKTHQQRSGVREEAGRARRWREPVDEIDRPQVSATITAIEAKFAAIDAECAVAIRCLDK